MADYLTFEQTLRQSAAIIAATNQLLNRIYAGERLTDELLARRGAYSRMREFSDLTTQSPRAPDGLDFQPEGDRTSNP